MLKALDVHKQTPGAAFLSVASKPTESVLKIIVRHARRLLSAVDFYAGYGLNGAFDLGVVQGLNRSYPLADSRLLFRDFIPLDRVLDQNSSCWILHSGLLASFMFVSAVSLISCIACGLLVGLVKLGE